MSNRRDGNFGRTRSFSSAELGEKRPPHHTIGDGGAGGAMGDGGAGGSIGDGGAGGSIGDGGAGGSIGDGSTGGSIGIGATGASVAAGGDGIASVGTTSTGGGASVGTTSTGGGPISSNTVVKSGAAVVTEVPFATAAERKELAALRLLLDGQTETSWQAQASEASRNVEIRGRGSLSGPRANQQDHRRKDGGHHCTTNAMGLHLPPILYHDLILLERARAHAHIVVGLRLVVAPPAWPTKDQATFWGSPGDSRSNPHMSAQPPPSHGSQPCGPAGGPHGSPVCGWIAPAFHAASFVPIGYQPSHGTPLL
eukprot:CAMPEP_0115428280 /NCGR_PEP_ID=MMETSP0271-20121206/29896_1 /TAXON_ID=71861 /ORGANISM="Scrippsiella trochoidea, Strain CCMP3099" /LENGTH=309 /DNA_ID=CAMNT_0002853369 /DNA_START=36 /DNA_END=965 /DNA_ORIENTATION=-